MIWIQACFETLKLRGIFILETSTKDFRIAGTKYEIVEVQNFIRHSIYSILNCILNTELYSVLDSHGHSILNSSLDTECILFDNIC